VNVRLYEAHRIPLRALFTLAADVRAEGVERMPRRGGVVLISNHLSMADPLILGMLFNRPLHFMAKEELYRIKPVGWWLDRTGGFPVRRGEIDRGALKRAEELLRAGEVVTVFPEGHRSDTAGAQGARTGAVLLASRARVPILPIGITGTERLRLRPLPGHTHWERFCWPRVTVRVGEPLLLEGGGRGAERRAAADLLMREIVALLPPEYHGVYSAEQ
jgi:1-acyl-sn-glycerol-3-phosphate acyltransferase